jgi:hypothetical protein
MRNVFDKMSDENQDLREKIKGLGEEIKQMKRMFNLTDDYQTKWLLCLIAIIMSPIA